jgi:hypothetical protein
LRACPADRARCTGGDVDDISQEALGASCVALPTGGEDGALHCFNASTIAEYWAKSGVTRDPYTSLVVGRPSDDCSSSSDAPTDLAEYDIEDDNDDDEREEEEEEGEEEEREEDEEGGEEGGEEEQREEDEEEEEEEEEGDDKKAFVDAMNALVELDAVEARLREQRNLYPSESRPAYLLFDTQSFLVKQYRKLLEVCSSPYATQNDAVEQSLRERLRRNLDDPLWPLSQSSAAPAAVRRRLALLPASRDEYHRLVVEGLATPEGGEEATRIREELRRNLSRPFWGRRVDAAAEAVASPSSSSASSLFELPAAADEPGPTEVQQPPEEAPGEGSSSPGI